MSVYRTIGPLVEEYSRPKIVFIEYYDNTPMQYTVIFHGCKNVNFQMKNSNMSRVMRKPDFCICENKDADQLRGTAKLISAFVFAIRIVQFLFYLNTKFQASKHILSLCSLVHVGPGRKPRRPVFSERGSYVSYSLMSTHNLCFRAKIRKKCSIPLCTPLLLYKSGM